MSKILHVDSSARITDSSTRQVSAMLVEHLNPNKAPVQKREANELLPMLTEQMVGSYFTSPDQRTVEQLTAIEQSDEVVKELEENDLYVIGLPMYNFSMPAAFKAWADLAARAGVTFRYTDTGPQGLLRNKKAYLVIATGGVEIGSAADFLTPWAVQFLNFIGIEDVTVINANDVQNASSLITQLH